MISKIKKPVSILLVFMMIVSLFAVVPITASAAVGDYVAENDSLTFTAEQDGSSVTIRVASGSLQYKKMTPVGSLILPAHRSISTRTIMSVSAEKILNSIGVITFRSPEE